MGKFDATIATYNKHAKHFAQRFENKLDAVELDQFLAEVKPGGRILDAGCGTARDSAYMISKGFQAQGIDISDGLLAEAAERHPEVPTQYMSLTEISFEDEAFDGVWCKAAILHLDRLEVGHVFDAFYRILKPGGVLFVQTKEGEGEGEQEITFEEPVARLFTFFTAEELESLVQSAGFELLKRGKFNGQWRFNNSRDIDWIFVLAKK